MSIHNKERKKAKKIIYIQAKVYSHVCIKIAYIPTLTAQSFLLFFLDMQVYAKWFLLSIL